MAGDESYGDRKVNIAFSISPQGLEEIFEVMGKVVSQQPVDIWSQTWGKICFCLDCAAEWASARSRAEHRRVLKRLSALLQYGAWGATPLDVLPHSENIRLLFDSGLLRGCQMLLGRELSMVPNVHSRGSSARE